MEAYFVTQIADTYDGSADRAGNVVEGEEGGPHRTLVADGAGARHHDQHGNEGELAGEGVDVHDHDGHPEENVLVVKETRDEVDLKQRGQTGGDRGPDDDDGEILTNEESVVDEGGDEREDGGGNVEEVVLPGLDTDIDGEVGVDVGGGGGHGGVDEEEQNQREQRAVLGEDSLASLTAENEIQTLAQSIHEGLEVNREGSGNELGHAAIIDLERDDGSANVGHASQREHPLVGDIKHVLEVRRSECAHKHQNQRNNGGSNGTRRLGGHSERLASAFVIGLLVNALHDERIDHDLSTALRRVQDNTHNQRCLVAMNHERIGHEDDGDNEGIENEVGNTTVFQNGEGVGDVAKHELGMRGRNAHSL